MTDMAGGKQDKRGRGKRKSYTSCLCPKQQIMQKTKKKCCCYCSCSLCLQAQHRLRSEADIVSAYLVEHRPRPACFQQPNEQLSAAAHTSWTLRFTERLLQSQGRGMRIKERRRLLGLPVCSEERELNGRLKPLTATHTHTHTQIQRWHTCMKATFLSFHPPTGWAWIYIGEKISVCICIKVGLLRWYDTLCEPLFTMKQLHKAAKMLPEPLQPGC